MIDFDLALLIVFFFSIVGIVQPSLRIAVQQREEAALNLKHETMAWPYVVGNVVKKDFEPVHIAGSEFSRDRKAVTKPCTNHLRTDEQLGIFVVFARHHIRALVYEFDYQIDIFGIGAHIKHRSHRSFKFQGFGLTDAVEADDILTFRSERLV